MTIRLFAEHLVNIRTLSIQADLETLSNQETRAILTSDGSILRLEHNGDVAEIQLPVHIPGDNHPNLVTPPASTKHLTFRVALQAKPGLLPSLDDSDQSIPWTASSLTADTEISCAHCHGTISQRGKVTTWKDLPSENWAEMMDFWHCHRPHVPHGQDHKTPSKGYSAGSTLAIIPGVGLVDPVDFVLASEDCVNLKILSSSCDNDDELLHCCNCKTAMGHVHTSGGYKLRKLHLSLSSSPDQPPVSHDARKWLSCLLLSSIDCQGVRKFTAQSTEPDTQRLKLWVFSPDVNISSSDASVSAPIRAAKVFWQDVQATSQDVGALNRQTLMEGELELPPDELHAMRKHLHASAAILPESARKFQDWNVAILPRFTNTDVAR